jgi:hypothetical protein
MTSPPDRRWADIATDLVEYLVVTIPDAQVLAAVVDELVRVGQTASIRVLDLAVIRVRADGTPEVLDADGFEAMRELASCYGILLSVHDLELVALALQPGDSAVVVVIEDRWAQPLARAAQANGGEVRAGERIASSRVEAALAHARLNRSRGG